MGEKNRKIKKIEVGKVTHDDTAGQKSLYIRIRFTSKLARESVLVSKRIEFPCASTTDFLDTFDSLAESLAVETTPDTILIVKELGEEELAIVAQAWQIVQASK